MNWVSPASLQRACVISPAISVVGLEVAEETNRGVGTLGVWALWKKSIGVWALEKSIEVWALENTCEHGGKTVLLALQ